MTYQLSAPEQWLALYGNILYRYAFVRIREPEISEDLVQETLLAALKARANYAGQASEQTWLIGILKHKMMDYFRKASRDKSQEYDELFASATDDDYFDQQGHWQTDLSSGSGPEKLLEQEQFLEILQACIDRLPPRMAQLFVLREHGERGNL